MHLSEDIQSDRDRLYSLLYCLLSPSLAILACGTLSFIVSLPAKRRYSWRRTRLFKAKPIDPEHLVRLCLK